MADDGEGSGGESSSESSGEEVGEEAAVSVALLRAALKGDAGEVEALLTARADPNYQAAATGSAPLHRAAARGHVAVVRCLLEARASACLRDVAFGGTPAEVARLRDAQSEVSCLLAAAASQEQAAAAEAAAVAPPPPLPPHLELLAAAFGRRAAEGELGQYTEGHMVVGEEDVREAFAAGSTLLYGELLPASASQLWAAMGLAQGKGEVLVELGMGTGKLALQAFAELPHLQRVVGVELAPTRYRVGEAALLRLAEQLPDRFRVAEHQPGMRLRLEEASAVTCGPRSLEFRCGDLLKVEGELLGSADAVLMQVCLPTSLHAAVCAKTREVKPGARIFCFADLPVLWPPDLEGPSCHLRRCLGADGGASDRRYKTSWSRDEGHQFYLLEVLEHIKDSAGAGGAGTARERAVMAANPSNPSWNEADEEWVPGMFRGGLREGEEEDLPLSLAAGTPVEVAARWRYRADAQETRERGAAEREGDGEWAKAWVVRAREGGAADVLFARDGTLEEGVPRGRLRPGRHAACAPHGGGQA